MLERLGGDARQVMQVAEVQARDLGSPVVGCAHLLLALAESGAIEGGLEAAGINFADLRGAIVADTEAIGSPPSSHRGRLPLGAPLLEVLRGGWRRSVTEKGASITPDHLVAEIIEQRPGDVVRLVTSLGARLEDIGRAPLPRSIRRRRAVTSRLFTGAAVPVLPEDGDDDDGMDEFDSSGVALPGPVPGDSRQRHPSRVSQRAVRTLRAVALHDRHDAERHQYDLSDPPPPNATVTRAPERVVPEGREPLPGWTQPGWPETETEPEPSEPVRRAALRREPEAPDVDVRRVDVRRVDVRRPRSLRRRSAALDLVCPHCDDDLDAVLLDLDLDGRDVEAMACPTCHVLLAAWPA